MTGAQLDTLNEAREQLSRDGWCVVPDVLTPKSVAQGKEILWRAARAQLAGGAGVPNLDPNAQNVRVNVLPAVDVFFINLLIDPIALSLVEGVLGTPPLVSNFSANIALPGSGSMRLHSDQSLVVPEPWLNPWAINIIWCLDDVHEENGATRYIPNSHRITRRDELPENVSETTVPFTASAGSFIAMDGRLWHTSGSNTTVDEERAMLFAYYSTDFLRQQMNWQAVLPNQVIGDMSAQTRKLFGLSPMGNTRIGAAATRLH